MTQYDYMWLWYRITLNDVVGLAFNEISKGVVNIHDSSKTVNVSDFISGQVTNSYNSKWIFQNQFYFINL